MRTFNIRYIKKFAVILTTAMLIACSNSDFLDINEDPNFSSTASNNLLMPSAQAGYVIAFSSMLERAAATMTQQYINGRFANYGFNGSSYDNQWSNVYASSLKDLDIIINQATENEQYHYLGIAKIQKAYVYSVLVDLFGDIPYSQSTGSEFNPELDFGEAIYPELISLIDEGLGDLDREADDDLSIADQIYNGNLTYCRKMANTLKFKLYLQTREVNSASSATEINSLIAGGNLITSYNENFSWQFSGSNAPEGRHPNFQSDWASGSLENTLAIFIINRMNALNDPRRSYYFYRQNATAGLSGVNGGEPSTPGDDNVRALFGIYPVGGAFDDGSFQIHNETLGLKGAGIYPMLTYTQLLFMQAEAALTLNTTGDPRTLLEAAILSSFNEVQTFSGVPFSMDETSDYVNNILALYDAAADDSERLEIIMDQKYYANYGNGIDSYNDYRRTGFPTGLLPPVVQNGPYPLRFPIPPVEFNSNSNVGPTEDVTVKVFWDIN